MLLVVLSKKVPVNLAMFGVSCGINSLFLSHCFYFTSFIDDLNNLFYLLNLEDLQQLKGWNIDVIEQVIFG